MVLYNASDREVVTKAFGNYFKFKPKQIKMMSDNIGEWIASKRGYEGLVALPSAFEDLDYRATKEGKAELEKARQDGIKKRIEHLEQIKHNLTVSLRSDMRMRNIDQDPRVFASDGEIEALEELAQYKKQRQDERQKKVDRVAELEKMLED